MNENSFHLVTRQHTGKPACDLEKFSLEQAKKVREFHRSFPMYAPTPLEPNLYLESFPGGASGKEPACQCRRHKRRGFDPCIEITWNRAWLPTPVFLP